MKAVQNITRLLALGLVLSLGTACSDIKLSKIDSPLTEGPEEVVLPSLDDVPFIELTSYGNSSQTQLLFDYLEDQNKSLSNEEKALILNDDLNNPIVKFRFKFLITESINWPSLSYQTRHIALNSPQYLLQIELGTRVITLNNQTNPLLYSYITIEHSYQDIYRITLSLMDTTSSQTRFSVFTDLDANDITYERTRVRIEADINGIQEADILYTRDGEPEYAPSIHICDYASTSFPANICD